MLLLKKWELRHLKWLSGASNLVPLFSLSEKIDLRWIYTASVFRPFFLCFCFSMSKYALFHPHFYVSISTLTKLSHAGQKLTEKNFLQRGTAKGAETRGGGGGMGRYISPIIWLHAPNNLTMVSIWALDDLRPFFVFFLVFTWFRGQKLFKFWRRPFFCWSSLDLPRSMLNVCHIWFTWKK